MLSSAAGTASCLFRWRKDLEQVKFFPLLFNHSTVSSGHTNTHSTVSSGHTHTLTHTALYLLAVVQHERMRGVKEACCLKKAICHYMQEESAVMRSGDTDGVILVMAVLSPASQQSFPAVQCEGLTCYCASVAVNFLFDWNSGISFAWTFHLQAHSPANFS